MVPLENLIWHLSGFYYFWTCLLPNLTLGQVDFLPFKLTYEASQNWDLEGAKSPFFALPLSLHFQSMQKIENFTPNHITLIFIHTKEITAEALKSTQMKCLTWDALQKILVCLLDLIENPLPQMGYSNLKINKKSRIE